MTTIHHPLDSRDHASMVQMRGLLTGMKGGITGPEARAGFDHMMGDVPAAAGVTYEAATVGGIAGFWCRPAEAADAKAAVLYHHGGAYVIGSARAYQPFVGQIVARTGVAAFVPEYRLAPEHPFPAAVDDAQAAYQGLVALGFSKIALVGDSAGGGLSLSLLSLVVAQARSGKGVAPVAAFVMSPWTDLALTSPSMHRRDAADPLLTQASLATLAQMYLGDHDARNPQVSPVYADLAGLPPVLIHVGEDEVLLDDSVRYGERLAQHGGHSQVHVWQGMVHVFPSSVATLHAARAALDHAALFLQQQLRG